MTTQTGASILDHPIISERYFFPRGERPREVVEVRSEDERLLCAGVTIHPGAPTVLHFHGNGEVVADYAGDFDVALGAAGFNSFFAEYRGYGGSSGVPSLVAMLDDVMAMLEATGRPAGEVIVYGRSVGSIYAIELARRAPDIAGLVIESGIADPLERVLMRVAPDEIGATLEQMQEAAARHLDHRRKLGAFEGPMLVMHARGDSLVTPDNAERNASWAGGEVKTRLFDRGDHNTILYYNGAEILEELRGFAHQLGFTLGDD